MTEISVPYRIGAERRATTRCSHDECWSLHGDRYRGRLWCHFGDLKILFAYLLQSTSEGNPGDTVLIRITVWRLLRRVGVEEGNNNFYSRCKSFGILSLLKNIKENAPIHFQMHSHFLFLNINTYYSVHPRQLASYVVVGRLERPFTLKGSSCPVALPIGRRDRQERPLLNHLFHCCLSVTSILYVCCCHWIEQMRNRINK